MSRMSRAMSPAAFALSVLAVIVATSAGTAYATILVGTKNIKNGAVTSAKIKDGTIQGVDVRSSTLNGSKVADGSLGLADLSASTKAALQVRAYASVDPNSGSPVLIPGRARGITAVSRNGIGDYCLTLNPALGIDAAKVSVVVTPEYGYSAGDTLQPYWEADSDCGAGKVHVYTEQAGTSSDAVAFTVLVP
jgi:hypothetical protein